MADVTRSDVATLIQEEYSNDLLAAAAASSVALSAFRTVPMGSKVTNMPVLATLPEADWVGESATDPSGVKPTSKATWTNKVLTAEEVAVIIPVHENAVDDATVSLVEELTSLGGEAIGAALDAAILFGVNKPVSWTSPSLLAAATGAGQTVTVGTVEDDLVGSIFQAAGMVDEAGWDPTTVLAPRGLRFRLANLRASASDGTPVFLPSMSAAAGSTDTVAGLSSRWVQGRVWDRDAAEALVVDRERVVIGVRQDVTIKFLDQATVGGINLAERDMVALRFKARYAYVLGTGVTTEGTAQVPVAAVLPQGS